MPWQVQIMTEFSIGLPFVFPEDSSGFFSIGQNARSYECVVRCCDVLLQMTESWMFCGHKISHSPFWPNFLEPPRIAFHLFKNHFPIAVWRATALDSYQFPLQNMRLVNRRFDNDRVKICQTSKLSTGRLFWCSQRVGMGPCVKCQWMGTQPFTNRSIHPLLSVTFHDLHPLKPNPELCTVDVSTRGSWVTNITCQHGRHHDHVRIEVPRNLPESQPSPD